MKRASADCQTKRPKPGDSVFLVQFQAKNDTESRDYLPPPKRAPNPWDDSTVSRCTIHRIRLAKDSSGIVSFVLNRRRANAARWGAYVGVPYAGAPYAGVPYANGPPTGCCPYRKGDPSLRRYE